VPVEFSFCRVRNTILLSQNRNNCRTKYLPVEQKIESVELKTLKLVELQQFWFSRTLWSSRTEKKNQFSINHKREIQSSFKVKFLSSSVVFEETREVQKADSKIATISFDSTSSRRWHFLGGNLLAYIFSMLNIEGSYCFDAKMRKYWLCN
jgi:hypothetical protein